MLMSIFPFSSEIVFNESEVNVIEIANKKLFTNIVNGINNKIKGLPTKEKIVLKNDEEEISFSKDVFFMLDIFNYDFNNKNILSKLYNKIERDIVLNEELFESLKRYISNIQEIVNEITSEYSVIINNQKDVDIQDILKNLKIQIDVNNELSPLDRIYYLIDLIEMFNICKLVIFVNLKTYFDDDQIVEIYKYSKYKKVNILLIEQKPSIQNLKFERKLLIDEDFYDIII